MDKTELLEALEDEHQEMIELLEDLSDEVMLQPGVIGEWSIKDTLAHLTHWEGQIVTLLFQAKQGLDQPSTSHFGKESVEEVNQRWFEMSKSRTLAQIWADWLGVRKQTIRRVSAMTEKELADPQHYSWQRGMPLWEWVMNDSFGHELEHGDAIREWLDQQDTASNNGHE